MTKDTDVDNYIDSYPKETQTILKKVRATISKAAPKAELTMNYGIPTFKLNGGNLVHFAGYKTHIGFYPAPSAIEAFKKEIAKYKWAKGSVQFPIDKPMPLSLITQMTKFRVAESNHKAKPAAKKEKSAKKTAPKKTAVKKSTQRPALTDKQQVSEHIKKLDPPVEKIVSALRKIILSVDKEIGERIKWNNPSFYYAGEMKASDPKEYKRELIVFNLHKNRIMLVFPSGAKVNDTTGFLEGDYPDGRRLVVFKDLKDVKAKESILKKVIKTWLTLIDD